MSARMPLLMATLTLALRAKCGEADPLTLSDLLTQAQQLLGTDDPLFRAISAFAVQSEIVDGADELRAIGAELHRQLELILMPVPDTSRADIHG
jgi:hypothetical protein